MRGRWKVLLRAARIAAIVAVAAAVLPLTACAGQVFGHVSGGGKAFKPGGKFLVLRGDEVVRSVTTDSRANYRAYLEPGPYTVRLVDDQSWHATIQSLLDPVRQDIEFKQQ